MEFSDRERRNRGLQKYTSVEQRLAQLNLRYQSDLIGDIKSPTLDAEITRYDLVVLRGRQLIPTDAPLMKEALLKQHRNWKVC